MSHTRSAASFSQILPWVLGTLAFAVCAFLALGRGGPAAPAPLTENEWRRAETEKLNRETQALEMKLRAMKAKRDE